MHAVAYVKAKVTYFVLSQAISHHKLKLVTLYMVNFEGIQYYVKGAWSNLNPMLAVLGNKFKGILDITLVLPSLHKMKC